MAVELIKLWVFFSENLIFLWVYPEKFNIDLLSHLFFPDTNMYIGSHKKIMGKKPMKKFSPEIQTQNMKEL